MLESIITSKTRLKLLIKFFVTATSRGYLRGIAEEFNESTNAIRKELNQLTEAGYLLKDQHNNKILYRANTNHSLFRPLQSLIHSYLGIEGFVDKILAKAGDVIQISLLGDYAKGIDSGHIEVLILGEDMNQIYLENLRLKAEALLNKEVTLYYKKRTEKEQQIILYLKEYN